MKYFLMCALFSLSLSAGEEFLKAVESKSSFYIISDLPLKDSFEWDGDRYILRNRHSLKWIGCDNIRDAAENLQLFLKERGCPVCEITLAYNIYEETILDGLQVAYFEKNEGSKVCVSFLKSRHFYGYEQLQSSKVFENEETIGILNYIKAEQSSTQEK